MASIEPGPREKQQQLERQQQFKKSLQLQNLDDQKVPSLAVSSLLDQSLHDAQ